MGRGMTERYVVFSHGKDSEPWGNKIAAMAEIAREEGFQVESVDYRGIEKPEDRVTRLLAFCKDLRGSLVLVGSSMGGYVSVAGSSLLQARGMFLLAPALYMPGYEKFSRGRPRVPPRSSTAGATRSSPSTTASASPASKRRRCTCSIPTTSCSTRSAPSITSSHTSSSRSTSSCSGQRGHSGFRPPGGEIQNVP